LVVKPFASLLPALQRGEVDLVISGVTITPERNARVAFAGPYFISGKSLLFKSRKITGVYNGIFANHRFRGGELVRIARDEPYLLSAFEEP
jgi:ABC-type amino acid transport substrate-binding protein